MKILIADEHTLFREGFRTQLQRFDVIEEIQEIDRFEALISLHDAKKQFHLVFIDRDILGQDWKTSFKSVISLFPNSRTVLLSDSEDSKNILESFDLGAIGYITKKSPASLTINALRLIMDGNSYVPSAVLNGIQKRKEGNGESRIISSTLPNGKNLTFRQSEVLQHLSNGLSNKQIAYEMSVSEATVKLHINALLRHLHVENRTKAVVTAQRMGILET